MSNELELVGLVGKFSGSDWKHHLSESENYSGLHGRVLKKEKKDKSLGLYFT